MPYTLHLNVGYPDNHSDWVHFQDESGEPIFEQRWRAFGPFEDVAERCAHLDALARRVIDSHGVQDVLFD